MATIEKTKARAKGGVVVKKRIVLVASEKGGVGKSVFARTLVDWLRSNNHRVAAYDADGAIGSTLRVLGERDDKGKLLIEQDAIKGANYYNGRSEDERHQLSNSVDLGEDLCIHDLAGGLLADLTRIVDDGVGLTGLLHVFEEAGYRLAVFHVLSQDIGATQSVTRWLELTKGAADHVAIVNLKHGKPPGDFPYWYGFNDAAGVRKGGNTREQLLLTGGVEVNFPSLPSGTFAKLDAENVKFSVAQDTRLLTITERAHVWKFLNDFEAAIKPALPFLGID